MIDVCRVPFPPFRMDDGRIYDIAHVEIGQPDHEIFKQICNIELLQRDTVHSYIDFFVFLHFAAFEAGLVGGSEKQIADYCCDQVSDWLKEHQLWVGYSTESIMMHINGQGAEVFIP